MWVFFIFDQDIGNYSKVRAKNDCPKVEGKKGVFATRSPCRFNPIGISAVHIDRVDRKNGAIYISGLDLIQGTYVVDLKPYLPADCIPEAKAADWVKSISESAVAAVKVEVSAPAKKAITGLVSAGKLQFYDRPEDTEELISEVLRQNPHSKSAIVGKVPRRSYICAGRNRASSRYVWTTWKLCMRSTRTSRATTCSECRSASQGRQSGLRH